jgi:alpha-mannosidase
LQSDRYAIELDAKTGNIASLARAGDRRNLADAPGLNQYTYLPDDALDKLEVAGAATIAVKEPGPLVASLVVSSPAPGATRLTREVRVVAGLDRVELIDTIDKTAVARKESVHFVFPFRVPGGQVRYQIPWGSVSAEADQLKDANRNWYTVQRWVDISNKDLGVTWSSPDAPLFEIGACTTAGLLGGLEDPAGWLHFTEQQSTISSWVMNNLWHTNFRRDQEGPTVFRYDLQAHGAYDPEAANRFGLESHQPLIVAPAAGPPEASLFFQIAANPAYVEAIAPARDGKGVVLQLVNVQDAPARATLSATDPAAALDVWETNLLEDPKQPLGTTLTIPARGVVMVRVERK